MVPLFETGSHYIMQAGFELATEPCLSGAGIIGMYHLAQQTILFLSNHFQELPAKSAVKFDISLIIDISLMFILAGSPYLFLFKRDEVWERETRLLHFRTKDNQKMQRKVKDTKSLQYMSQISEGYVGSCTCPEEVSHQQRAQTAPTDE